MNNQLVTIVVALLSGGSVTAVFSWMSNRKEQSVTSESIYADHTRELFDRIDKISAELEQEKTLRRQRDLENVKLRSTVKNQNQLIEELQDKIDYLTKMIEELKEN